MLELSQVVTRSKGKRSQRPPRSAAGTPSVAGREGWNGRDGLPDVVLQHILLTASTSPNLLRHVAVVACVCRAWRTVARMSAAYIAEGGDVCTYISLNVPTAGDTELALGQYVEDGDASSLGNCPVDKSGSCLYVWDALLNERCDKGFRALGAALHALPTDSLDSLRRIELQMLGALTGDGLAPLCTAIASGSLPRLKTILVDACPNVGNAGCLHLAAALPSTRIEMLSVTCVQCGDEGLEAVFAALPPTIKYLGCGGPTIASWRALAATLRRLPQLAVLSLANACDDLNGCPGPCGLCARGLALLALELPSAAPALRLLDLGGSCDGDVSVLYQSGLGYNYGTVEPVDHTGLVALVASVLLCPMLKVRVDDSWDESLSDADVVAKASVARLKQTPRQSDASSERLYDEFGVFRTCGGSRWRSMESEEESGEESGVDSDENGSVSSDSE